MTASPIIVWFRQDLRIEDHPALHAASTTGQPVLPVFIWDPAGEGPWPQGGASKFWLHQSLSALNNSLTQLGSPLILRKGNAYKRLQTLVKESGADSIYWTRRYEPHAIQRDTNIKKSLKEAGLTVKSFSGRLLNEPWARKTKSGTPYKVFTPYYKSCLAQEDEMHPLPAPPSLTPPESDIESLDLNHLKLEPKIKWAEGIRDFWTFGAKAAQKRFEDFLDDSILDYSEGRDIPAESWVSRMSPHLHFGEVSPRWLVHRAREMADALADPKRYTQTEEYIRELYWREFSYHLLYHFPHTPEQPLRDEFENFEWEKNKKHLTAWQKGLTGYPIVDAGMRQLWQTGWMHNRVRMIAASFLIKDLLIHWKEGADWFWDTLVDADLANNTQGWQWTAGSGADAAPYFRIFNPISQGKKFDPDGTYIKTYIPELSRLSEKYIHSPWEAPGDVLADAGITLGKTYPPPIVDHAEARKEALQRYKEMKE